jgi:hypothetical protein
MSFADASGTRQGDEPVGGGEAQDLLDLDVAADQLGNRPRQVRRWAGRGGNLLDRPCNRLRMRAHRDCADLPSELVAASGKRADQVAIRSEGVAQGRDLDLQAVLLDDPVRPDTVHQRVFADDSPLPLDKRHQHIKAAPAKVDRLTVGEELAAMRHDPETAELDDRRRFYREIHSRGLYGHFRGQASSVLESRRAQFSA